MESFTSYVVRSFVPRSFGRLCVLGVDLVGVPVLLLYGLPQNRVMLVAGWIGLRVALTGIRYLESRGDRDKVLEENVRVLDAKDACGAFSEEPATAPQGQQISIRAEMPVETESAVQAPVQVEVEDAKIIEEAAGIVFPRVENEPEEISTEGTTRMGRTVSMTSTDSNATLESEYLATPPQTTVELPIESDYDEDSLPTPRPDQIQRFSAYHDESHVWSPRDTDTSSSGPSSPDSRRPPLRKKSSKYGSCPRLLVPKRSNPSLQLSQVTYDRPEAFTS
ncbi:hypothetical protein RhiJN_19768 [Ceratobasidium sp. AG-Ba]|nr:hypothetical protein RhiJN_04937 [Ceratobasidium sp. AG-Ba]QRV91750.1 hypothetical protein RhiJN_19768 [Ceratobasidium sp. AG-Ba]